MNSTSSPSSRSSPSASELSSDSSPSSKRKSEEEAPGGPFTSTPLAPTKRRRLFTNESFAAVEESDETLATDLDSDQSELEEEEEEDSTTVTENGTNGVKKFVAKGKDYNLYKPKRKSSLYSQLIINYNNLQGVVNALCALYESSPNNAMELLLQLFVDVMGFQNIMIKYQDGSDLYRSIRVNLEENPAKLHEQFFCVLRGRSLFCKTFAKVFYSFLDILMRTFYDRGHIHDEKVYSTLILFVSEMCESKRQVLVYNAVLIVLKLCTSWTKICNDLTDRITQESSSSEDSQRMMDEKQLRKLGDCLDLMKALAYSKGCIPDPKMAKVRLAYTNEIAVWIKLNPEVFVAATTLQSLRMLIVDEHPLVRKAALTTSASIVKSTRNLNFLLNCGPIVQKWNDGIAGRLSDVNVDVRKACVRFFTCCLKNYTEAIPNEIQARIITLMYCKHYELAAECGLFLATVMRHEGDLSVTLRDVLQVTCLPQYEKGTALMVEAMYRWLPEMMNVPKVLLILVDRNECWNRFEETKLVEILYYVSKILITGTSEGKRMKPLKDINRTTSNQMIGKEVICAAASLLDIYVNDDSILKWLLKLLNVVDYLDSFISKYRVELKNITIILLRILDTNSNPEVLKPIAGLFRTFCDENFPLNDRFSPTIKAYIKCTVLKYEKLLLQLDEEHPKEEHLVLLRNSTLLLSVLFESHTTVNMVTWRQIYMDWNNHNLDPLVITYQMICCRWYLVWELQHILDNDPNDLDPKLNAYVSMMNDFVGSTIDILNSTNNNSLQISAFNCTYEFFKDYRNIFLQRKCPDKMPVDMTEYATPFCRSFQSFVIDKCFGEESESLKVRRQILTKYIILSLWEYVEPEEVLYVFKYLPAFKEDYSRIYRDVLEKFKKHKLASFVHGVLLLLYRKEETLGCIQAVATGFKSMIPRPIVVEVIKMGITFIAKEETHIGMILCLKPFVVQLSIQERKSLICYAKKNLSVNLYRNGVFVQFLKHLNSKKLNGNRVRQISNSSGVSTTPATSSVADESMDVDDTSIIDIDEVQTIADIH